MKRVRVALSERSYDVLIGEGGLSSRAFRECARSASRIALVSSAPILKRHGARLRENGEGGESSIGRAGGTRAS